MSGSSGSTPSAKEDAALLQAVSDLPQVEVQGYHEPFGVWSLCEDGHYIFWDEEGFVAPVLVHGEVELGPDPRFPELSFATYLREHAHEHLPEHLPAPYLQEQVPAHLPEPLSVHLMTCDTPELVPEPVPEPARCLSYREMTHLTFYELLQCNVTAHARTLIRQYGRLARTYHPDKGGAPMSFRYLKMAYDVLKDPETRAEYDRDGKGRWTAAFQTDEPPPLIRATVPSPRVNRAFLKSLCKMRGAFSHHIGQFNLHSYLDAVLTRVSTDDVYEECSVAAKLGLQLRLVAKGARSSMPVFPQPRVVRYAAFMGMDVI